MASTSITVSEGTLMRFFRQGMIVTGHSFEKLRLLLESRESKTATIAQLTAQGPAAQRPLSGVVILCRS